MPTGCINTKEQEGVHTQLPLLLESEALCESQPLLQLFIINPHPPTKDLHLLLALVVSLTGYDLGCEEGEWRDLASY